LKGVKVHLRKPLEVETRASFSKEANVGPVAGGLMPKLGLAPFNTRKRHPFIWCCDNCLHKGWTRTYVLKFCFLPFIV